jgi:hypothetical protein
MRSIGQPRHLATWRSCDWTRALTAQPSIFANEADIAAGNPHPGAPDPHRLLAEAQVHATLPVAAATALAATGAESRAWADVAATKLTG